MSLLIGNLFGKLLRWETILRICQTNKFTHSNNNNKKFSLISERSCYKLRRLLSAAQNELVTLNLKQNTYTNGNGDVSKHIYTYNAHTQLDFVHTIDTGTLKSISFSLSRCVPFTKPRLLSFRKQPKHL